MHISEYCLSDNVLKCICWGLQIDKSLVYSYFYNLSLEMWLIINNYLQCQLLHYWVSVESFRPHACLNLGGDLDNLKGDPDAIRDMLGVSDRLVNVLKYRGSGLGRCKYLIVSISRLLQSRTKTIAMQWLLSWLESSHYSQCRWRKWCLEKTHPQPKRWWSIV